MGASTFSTVAQGKTAKDAFKNAVEGAKHQHGHGGYTSTIAEKRSFTMISLPEGKDANQYVNELIDNDDPRIEDKWGPAGCIALGDGKWLFFGWASD
jgi:hypothetical protein